MQANYEDRNHLTPQQLQNFCMFKILRILKVSILKKAAIMYHSPAL